MQGGLVKDGESGLDELMILSLARRDPIHGQYMNGDLPSAISDMADRMGRLAALLRAGEEEDRQHSRGGIRWVPTNNHATAVLSAACETVASYVWTCHPTDRNADVLASSVTRDLGLLERGVQMRTIYPDTARTRPAETAWAAAVSEAGAEVRTDVPPFMRMVIVGGDEHGRGAVAVVEDPEHTDASGTQPRPAYIVTSAVMIKVLEHAYSRQWDAAEPWMGGIRRRPDGTFTTPRQRKILNALRDQTPASVIQRELGISAKTYQNDIAKLYEGSSTKGLFALGYWWGSEASAAERRRS